MKIIDGKGAVLGRLASFVAKETLKGEQMAIVNSDKIIISGNKKNIKENFEEKRSKFGSSQKGPKHHRTSDKIVKRAIRGMLPNHRTGRGREAFKKIKCYVGIPKEFQKTKAIKLNQGKPIKYSEIKEFIK